MLASYAELHTPEPSIWSSREGVSADTCHKEWSGGGCELSRRWRSLLLLLVRERKMQLSTGPCTAIGRHAGQNTINQL